MVGTYYLMWLPYKLAWCAAKVLRRKKLFVVHLEDAFDYFLFRNIRRHLAPLDIVVSSTAIVPKLKPFIEDRVKIYHYPFCFPDGVIMFRNAAWKYPVSKIVKIGLEHGAYNFKRFPHSTYYNLFNLYLMTSGQDVKRLIALGARTVKSVGYPKSDSLFDGSYSPAMLDTLRQKLDLDSNKPVLLFSSTWDGSGMSAVYKWYNKVQELCGSYNVMVTLHPRMSKFYRDFLSQVPGIRYIDAMDIYPYLLLADVCIGDTNSLIAEFCIVNKPIITFSITPTARTMDDVISLIVSISIRVDDFHELPAAITKALATSQTTAAARKQVIGTLIDPLDGKAGLRAAQEIIKLIPELEP